MLGLEGVWGVAPRLEFGFRYTLLMLKRCGSVRVFCFYFNRVFWSLYCSLRVMSFEIPFLRCTKPALVVGDFPPPQLQPTHARSIRKYISRCNLSHLFTLVYRGRSVRLRRGLGVVRIPSPRPVCGSPGLCPVKLEPSRPVNYAPHLL